MPAILLKVFGEDIAIDCAPHEARRLEDLAAALNARLDGFGPDLDGKRRLVLTALALMDEAQAKGAALFRMRAEIERLTDALVEAGQSASARRDDDARGLVASLRTPEGAA